MDALELEMVLESVDIPRAASATIERNEEVIADLNATQMSQGKRSDGSEILPSYRPMTVDLKMKKSGLAGVTDRVTLFDKGDHYRGLYAKVKGLDIEYGSADQKSEKLQDKYDTARGSIYGLNLDSRDELVEGHLRSDFQNDIEKQTGLKFR